MNRNGIRIAAFAMAGTIAFSGYHTSIYAKTNMNKVLPAAGIAVVLEEGNTIQELTKEVIENIAYLESASGLQPNIVIATEQVPLASHVDANSEVQVPLAFSDIALASTPKQSKAVSDELLQAVVDPQSQETEEHQGVDESEVSKDDKQGLLTDVVGGEDKKADESGDTETETSVEKETTETEKTEASSEEESLTESETTVEGEEETETESDEESEEETKSNDSDSEKEETTGNLVIAKVNKYVNVRSIPSEEGEIVGKLYDKSVGEMIEEVDGWYKITSGECTGYVKGLYVVTGKEADELAKEVGTTYAKVNASILNIRKEANTDSEILGRVPNEEELIVVEDLGDWVKVAIEEGDGYVSKEYVELRTEYVHAESKAQEEKRLAEEKKAREEALKAAQEKEQAERERREQEQQQLQEQQQQQENAAVATETVQEIADETVPQQAVVPSSGSELGNAVISYATQFVGNPYVYGGSSLTNGTDCSGFVMRVYENFGVNLPHSSSAMRSKGYDVGGLENAQPGDIVCYSGHVGLYVGNGQIVHASTSRTGIIVSNANYRQILTVRRIF